MGHHAYDGSFTSVSFVPPGESVNFTVESATVRSAASETTVDAASSSTTPADNVVVVSSNATAVLADDLAIVVHPSAFYGAAANITATSWGLSIECGELGTLSVTFSHASYAHDPRDPTVLRFNLTTGSPFVMWLTFGSPHTTPDATAASKVIEAGRSAVLADIAAAAALSKSSFDVVDAMTTAIAWNVNFDPRVAVTAPVSRTFESGFDFIFFGEQRDENAGPRRIFFVHLVVIANGQTFTPTLLLLPPPHPHSHSFTRMNSTLILILILILGPRPRPPPTHIPTLTHTCAKTTRSHHCFAQQTGTCFSCRSWLRACLRRPTLTRSTLACRTSSRLLRRGRLTAR
jgi:hypothetical protein